MPPQFGPPGKVILVDLCDQTGRVLMRKKAFPADSGTRMVKITHTNKRPQKYMLLSVAPFPDSSIQGPLMISDLSVTVTRDVEKLGQVKNLAKD